MIQRAWLAPDALDARIAFYAYAAVAGVGGFILAAWGQIWLGSDLPGMPWGKAALIRVFGSILIAAAVFAIGFAKVEDPPSRHRALLWFAIGHAVVFLMVASQQFAIGDSWNSELGDSVARLLNVVVFLLFALWGTAAGLAYKLPPSATTLFHRDSPSTTERVRAAYEQQIRQTARQEERNRLARDLHDAIKQQIFVIRTAAATAQVRFDSDRVGARQAIDQVSESAGDAMTEMEVMLDQLQAAPLETTGLVESIRKQCEALKFRTGADVDFEVGTLPANATFVPGAQEAVLRVAQEALSNVARHARSGRVHVKLESIGNQLTLTIRDNGGGFDPNRASGGMGIHNMSKRAEEFDGDFEIIGKPGDGTRIRFSVPFAVTMAESYKRQTLVSAAFLVPYFAFAVWRGDPLLLAFCVVLGSFHARSAFAWYRLRQPREANQ